MKTQAYSKETEVKMLRDLSNYNGYFKYAFTEEDLQIMEDNVKKDFDLLCGTSRDQSSETARMKQEIINLRKKVNEKNAEMEALSNKNATLSKNYYELLFAILHDSASRGDYKFEDMLINQKGQRFIIQTKLSEHIELTERDKDYIFTNLK